MSVIVQVLIFIISYFLSKRAGVALVFANERKG